MASSARHLRKKKNTRAVTLDNLLRQIEQNRLLAARLVDDLRDGLGLMHEMIAESRRLRLWKTSATHR